MVSPQDGGRTATELPCARVCEDFRSVVGIAKWLSR
jgi:hypothetical protein